MSYVVSVLVDKITFKRRRVARSIPIWTRECAANAKCGKIIVRVRVFVNCTLIAGGDRAAAKVSLVGVSAWYRAFNALLYDSRKRPGDNEARQVMCTLYLFVVDE